MGTFLYSGQLLSYLGRTNYNHWTTAWLRIAGTQPLQPKLFIRALAKTYLVMYGLIYYSDTGNSKLWVPPPPTQTKAPW